MDLETFEVFETDLIEDSAKEKIRQGVQVEYWRVLGKNRIMRVKEA
jgi:translation initiation factor 5A